MKKEKDGKLSGVGGDDAFCTRKDINFSLQDINKWTLSSHVLITNL